MAAADPTGTIATPLRTLERDRPGFWTELSRACVERECALMVVGLPRRLDGSEGEAAQGARRFAAEVTRRLGVEVALWDERLTTALAERTLIAAGVRRAERRTRVDAVAATLILQSYLDAHTAPPPPARGGSPSAGDERDHGLQP